MTSAPSKKWGAGMQILFWLLLLVMLYLGFADYLSQRTNPNQQIEGTAQGNIREVILRSARGGHYVASGEINGQPVTFLVDTGATLVALPTAVARQLKVQSRGQGLANTAGGVVRVDYATLDSVRLGNIVLHDVRASINPELQEVLLGMSFLRELELIHRDGELRIRQRY